MARSRRDAPQEPQAFDRTNPSAVDTAGSGGGEVFGGYINFHEAESSLIGSQRFVTFATILANSGLVAASMRIWAALCGNVSWQVQPAKDGGREAEEVAEFVWGALYDMETPWSKVVRRACLHRAFGFSVQEWTAKRREDGMIGFADVANRPQASIERWDISRIGKVLGVEQIHPTSNERIYLPAYKILLLSDDVLEDTYGGLGMLRSVVRDYNRMEAIEKQQGWGFEYDLRGMPIARAPLAALRAAVKAGLLSEEDKLAAEQPLRTFLSNHRKTPDLGLLLESDTLRGQDQTAAPSATYKWGMELLRGGGTTIEASEKAVQRLERRMARVFGTEKILLGETGAGSEALSRDKTQLLAALISDTLTDVAEAVEIQLVLRLLTLNSVDRRLAPTLAPSRVNFHDIQTLVASLKDLATAGATIAPDDPVVDTIRDILGLPPVPEIDPEDMVTPPADGQDPQEGDDPESDAADDAKDDVAEEDD